LCAASHIGTKSAYDGIATLPYANFGPDALRIGAIFSMSHGVAGYSDPITGLFSYRTRKGWGKFTLIGTLFACFPDATLPYANLAPATD